MDERIFCGCFTTGLVWADKKVERHGDYKRLAYMNYGTLLLEVEKDCPKKLRAEIEADAARIQAKRGEAYPVAGNMTVILGGRA